LGRRTGAERGSDRQGPRVAERRARSGLGSLRRCKSSEVGAQYRPVFFAGLLRFLWVGEWPEDSAALV